MTSFIGGLLTTWLVMQSAAPSFNAEYDPATRKVSNIYFNGGG